MADKIPDRTLGGDHDESYAPKRKPKVDPSMTMSERERKIAGDATTAGAVGAVEDALERLHSEAGRVSRAKNDAAWRETSKNMAREDDRHNAELATAATGPREVITNTPTEEHPSYPFKLGDTMVASVGHLSNVTAEEVEKAARDLMEAARFMEKELLDLAKVYRERGDKAHEYMSQFANMSTSLLETIRGVSSSVRGLNGKE